MVNSEKLKSKEKLPEAEKKPETEKRVEEESTEEKLEEEAKETTEKVETQKKGFLERIKERLWGAKTTPSEEKKIGEIRSKAEEVAKGAIRRIEKEGIPPTKEEIEEKELEKLEKELKAQGKSDEEIKSMIKAFKEKKEKIKKEKEISEERRARRLLNEAKIKEKLKAEGKSDEEIAKALKQVKFAESGEIKRELGSEINKLIESLSKEINREEKEKIIKELAEETGLEQGVIESALANCQSQIHEWAKQAESRGKSFLKNLGKNLAKTGVYMGAGIGLGFVVGTGGLGGVGIGVGIGLVRLGERYLAEKKAGKKVDKYEEEFKKMMAEGKEIGEGLKKFLSQSLIAELAVAKQNRIDGKDEKDKKNETDLAKKEKTYLENFGKEKGKIGEIKRENINGYKEYKDLLGKQSESFIADIKQKLTEEGVEAKEQEKILSQIKALFEVEQHNSLLEAEIRTKNPDLFKRWDKWSEKNIPTLKVFFKGGETIKEKLATAGVFTMAGFLARAVPGIRHVLMGFAGLKAGEALGMWVTGKMERFKELAELKAEDLPLEKGAEIPDELLNRARAQLLDEKFKKNKPAEYAKLKERVEQITEQKIKKANKLLDLISNSNKGLEETYLKREKLEKERRRVLLEAQIAGAVAGVFVAEHMGDIMKGIKKIAEKGGVLTKEQLEAQEKLRLGKQLEEVTKGLSPEEKAQLLKDLKAEKLTLADLERLAGPDKKIELSDLQEAMGKAKMEVFGEHHKLLSAVGAEVKMDATGKFHAVLEIGKGKDFAALDQALRRVVYDNLKVGDKFGAMDAAKAENMIANLRELLQGKSVAGFKPEDFKNLMEWNPKTGTFEIKDFNGFLDKFQGISEHAGKAITETSDALAYANNTREGVLKQMFEQRGVKVEVGDISHDPRVIAAEERIMTRDFEKLCLEGKVEELKVIDENNATATVDGEKVIIKNGRVVEVGEEKVDFDFRAPDTGEKVNELLNPLRRQPWLGANENPDFFKEKLGYNLYELKAGYDISKFRVTSVDNNNIIRLKLESGEHLLGVDFNGDYKPDHYLLVDKDNNLIQAFEAKPGSIKNSLIEAGSNAYRLDQGIDSVWVGTLAGKEQLTREEVIVFIRALKEGGLDLDLTDHVKSNNLVVDFLKKINGDFSLLREGGQFSPRQIRITQELINKGAELEGTTRALFAVKQVNWGMEEKLGLAKMIGVNDKTYLEEVFGKGMVAKEFKYENGILKISKLHPEGTSKTVNVEINFNKKETFVDGPWFKNYKGDINNREGMKDFINKVTGVTRKEFSPTVSPQPEEFSPTVSPKGEVKGGEFSKTVGRTEVQGGTGVKEEITATPTEEGTEIKGMYGRLREEKFEPPPGFPGSKEGSKFEPQPRWPGSKK